MPEARHRLQTLSWNELKPVWLPLDVIVQWSNALLAATVVLATPRLAHASAYLLLHALIAAAVYVLAKLEDARSRALDPLAFLHDWLPAVFVMLVYFELGMIIPALRDYSDFRYDHALQAIDLWLLGDPVAWIARCASPLLSDILTVCYVAYYPYAIAVPLALYIRGTRAEYQRAAAVVLMAFLVSYAGYVVWPALGPHRLFDVYRPAELDGYGLARVGYGMFRGLPNEPPDAFPSGHTLIGVLVPWIAYRFYRPLLVWLIPVGIGIVLATVYLRFHYLADLAGSFVLAPVVWQLAAAVERRYRSHAALGPALQQDAFEEQS
ncbi:MAG: phosphatase PAP2 family protein [Polyangiales bacterium]